VSHSAGITGRGRGELAAVLASGKRFVTPADVASALGVDPDAAAKRLSRWAKEGWVRRVRRGLYISVPVEAINPAAWSEDALVVGTVIWAPCYFTGWTSASHWALTEQVFRTTVLKTTQRVRSSRVCLLDHDYLLTRTTHHALSFGIASEWHDTNRVLFADPARTVVDVLDEPRLAGGIRHAADIAATFLDDHDPALLIEYGDTLGNRTVFKRLGYILEALHLDASELVSACLERVSQGISPLDPDGQDTGHRIMRWGLRVNVTITPQEPN
jgi:predicted transcriptional regulator of viral defense system